MPVISVFRRFWRITAKILLASIVIAAIAANSHPIIAAIVTYFNRFISGEMDPFWPHVWLLSLSVVASIAVGGGIIFERPKYSEKVHKVAFWLVVAGIVAEAGCTIFLFAFDEGVSSAQQSKIATLNTELIERLPRRIRPAQEMLVVDSLKQVPKGPVWINPAFEAEATQFAGDIVATLRASGFDPKPVDFGKRALSFNRPGLLISVKDHNNPPKHAAAISAAFGNIGFKMEGYEDSALDPESIEIGVSSHP